MTGKATCNRAPIVPFKTTTDYEILFHSYHISKDRSLSLQPLTAMMMCATAIADNACLQERPTANIELASCHTATFDPSDIQYAT